MKQQFIETENTKNVTEMFDELISPMSLIGPSLAIVTGPAGRGKSEASQHYAVHNGAVYIPPMNIRTPATVLREITFELQNIRPQRFESCVLAIGESMAKERKLIIIDEADLLPIAILEMLRNLNERCGCPIVLIGEEQLKVKIGTRRRLYSRIRRRLDFSPINQHDIAYFFRAALGVKLGPEVTAIINRHANGDWRPVLTAAISIERAMNASGVKEPTLEMFKNVIKYS